MASNSFKVKNSLNITPSATSGDEAGDIRVDSGDSNKVKYHNGTSEIEIPSASSTTTLTNKTIDGDDNTVQDLALTSIKTVLADASNFLVRDASGIPVSNTKAVPSGTVVGTSDSQTLTNKTIDADANTITNIDNADIKVGAAIDATKIADGSISSTEFQYLEGATSNIQTQLDGKVAGPASATDNAVARYDGTTGKLVQDSATAISDGGIVTTTTASGYGFIHSNGTHEVATYVDGAAGYVGTKTNIDLAFFVNNGNAAVTIDKDNGFVGVNKLNAAATIDVGSTAATDAIRINGGSSGWTGIRVPDTGDEISYTLPGDNGDPGEVLTTDGSGTLSWGAVGTGDIKSDGSVAMAAPLEFPDGSASLPSITNTGDTNTGVFFPAADAVGIATGGIERTRIASDGSQSSVITGGSTLIPQFPIRGWVNFDGSTLATVSGTYSRTLTTVTVTLTGHGHQVGQYVQADFTSGTATDGGFVITTVADANTFTFEHGTSGSTSGNVTLNRVTIRGSGNVHSVYRAATGAFVVNWSTAMPDTNYIIWGGGFGTYSAPDTISMSNLITGTHASAAFYGTVTAQNPNDATNANNPEIYIFAIR